MTPDPCPPLFFTYEDILCFFQNTAPEDSDRMKLFAE